MIVKKGFLIFGTFFLIAAIAFFFQYFVIMKNPRQCAEEVFHIRLPDGANIEKSLVSYNLKSFPDRQIYIKVHLEETEYLSVLSSIHQAQIMTRIDKNDSANIMPKAFESCGIETQNVTDIFYCWTVGTRKMTYYMNVIFSKESSGLQYLYLLGM